jgi:arylsulfatase A-like enzyme
MIRRRTFLRRFADSTALAAAGAAGLTPLAGCGGPELSRDPELPNILLITADNLGWRDLGCYGNRDVRTPNLDRLAREGVKFERAFVVSSTCAPSRASFITGQYPHTHGVTGLTHLAPRKSLSPFRTTLPDLLAAKGYNTAIEGKWHVSPYLPTSWYGYNERLSGLLPEQQRIRDTRTTIDFLRRNRRNRFFLQVNYQNSHRDRYGEYHYDPEFPVDPNAIRVPDYMALPDWPEIREDLARYYSQNLRMERMVGELLRALEDLGLADNTLVLFVSDNGPHYPGMISTLYDRGTATPLLVRWPRALPAGRSLPQLVSSIDLMPTLLEAAHVGIPDDVQGESLLALMLDPRAPWSRDAVFMEQTEHVRYIACRAVRTSGWKYIRNYSDNAFGLDQNNHDAWAHRMCELPGHPWKRPRPPEELYGLAQDPHEQRNLAGDPAHEKRLEAMRERLRRHMVATSDPYLDRPFRREFDPERYEPVDPGHAYW